MALFERVEIAIHYGSDRCRFVVYQIRPLPNEYHIYKEVRDAFGGKKWSGAVVQCEHSQQVARQVARRMAAEYVPPPVNAPATPAPDGRRDADEGGD